MWKHLAEKEKALRDLSQSALWFQKTTQPSCSE